MTELIGALVPTLLSAGSPDLSIACPQLLHYPDDHRLATDHRAGCRRTYRLRTPDSLLQAPGYLLLPCRMDRPIWRYVLIGLIGGFLSGFAGIGGGVVLIPLMVGLLGVSQHQAHGTSLAIIIPTAIVAMIPYFTSPAEGKPPPMDLAVAYTVTAVIGAPVGAKLITYVNPKELRKLFGLLLLSLSLASLSRGTPPPLVTLGNLALVAGLVALVLGTLYIAVRQRRATATTAPAAAAGGAR